MFKCEVTRVSTSRNYQETLVYFKISNKGSSKIPNHKILEKSYHNRFIIGQIDRSIKIGDLIRCDGLPFMAKPVNSRKCVYWTRDEKTSNNQKNYGYITLIPGYSPFQLNSGYWVLRKK